MVAENSYILLHEIALLASAISQAHVARAPFCNTRKQLSQIAIPQLCRNFPNGFLRSPTVVFIRPLISRKRTPGHNSFTDFRFAKRRFAQASAMRRKYFPEHESLNNYSTKKDSQC
jgi:hypothetical protein